MNIDWEKEDSILKEIEITHRGLSLALHNEEEAIQTTQARHLSCQQAQDALQQLAQSVQTSVHKRLAGTVSSCLSAVFEDPYAMEISFERKRGRTEAVLKFSRRGLEVDPLTATGGGMVDVAAFALRVACIMMHQPRLSRLIVLDEPFKFVSAEYHEHIRSMLEQLSKDLKIQIVMVTHIPKIATGNVIRI